MPYSKIYIDGRLLGYGDKLFEEPVKRVVIKKPRVFNLLDPISSKEKGVGWSKSSVANKGALLRDQIDRTVKRDPEVMLKVTSKKEAGKGMKQIGSHLDYISRNGKVELETDQGEIIFMALDGTILKQKKVTKRPINHVLWWKEHLVAVTFGGELLALDPLTFEKVGRFSLGHDQSGVFGDMALSEQGLGILSSRNRLFFFE
jgi:hypothetical protein